MTSRDICAEAQERILILDGAWGTQLQNANLTEADFRWPARGRVIAGFSGKGGNEYWAAKVAPGRIMFELDGVPAEVARKALELAAAKLPIKTRFVQRIAE